MNGNDVMGWILRSPLHGIISNGMVLITITGRKTGKKYTTPVGYYMEDGTMWVITSRDRTWWKNLRGGAPVGLLLKRNFVQGFAEPDLDEKSVAARMVEYLQQVPQAAGPMGVRRVGGRPDPQDMARTAKDRLFIKIKLQP